MTRTPGQTRGAQPTQCTQSGSPSIASGPEGSPMTRWVTSPAHSPGRRPGERRTTHGGLVILGMSSRTVTPFEAPA